MADHGEAIEVSDDYGKSAKLKTEGNLHTNEANRETSPNAGGRLNSMLRVRRLFSGVQIFFFSLTYMSIWESMCSAMMFPLYNGGSQTFAWSILIAWIGAMTQAASIAEMASCIPIAGAQYHWANYLAPHRMKKFTTWLQGWMTWFGWVTVLAAIVNVTMLVLEAMITLQNPSYVPKGWHTACYMIAMLVTFGIVNSFR